MRCAGEMPGWRRWCCPRTSGTRNRTGPGAAVARRAWPCGRGSCWPAREGAGTWPSPRNWAYTAALSARGGRGSRPGGWTGWLAGRVRGAAQHHRRPGGGGGDPDLGRGPRRGHAWSKRELARRVGISPTSVHRIWRAFGLQPGGPGPSRSPRTRCSPARQDPRRDRPVPICGGEPVFSPVVGPDEAVGPVNL